MPTVIVQRDPALIRSDIARARLDVAQSVDRLREEVRVRMDWRVWFAKQTLPMLGAAFVVGLFVAHPWRSYARISDE